MAYEEVISPEIVPVDISGDVVVIPAIELVINGRVIGVILGGYDGNFISETQQTISRLLNKRDPAGDFIRFYKLGIEGIGEMEIYPLSNGQFRLEFEQDIERICVVSEDELRKIFCMGAFV